MFAAATARSTHAELPEWGPAKHDPQHPLHRMTAEEAAFSGVDLRDGDESRPDDN